MVNEKNVVDLERLPASFEEARQNASQLTQIIMTTARKIRDSPEASHDGVSSQAGVDGNARRHGRLARFRSHRLDPWIRLTRPSITTVRAGAWITRSGSRPLFFLQTDREAWRFWSHALHSPVAAAEESDSMNGRGFDLIRCGWENRAAQCLWCSWFLTGWNVQKHWGLPRQSLAKHVTSPWRTTSCARVLREGNTHYLSDDPRNERS